MPQWYFTGIGFQLPILFSRAKHIGMFVLCEVFHAERQFSYKESSPGYKKKA